MLLYLFNHLYFWSKDVGQRASKSSGEPVKRLGGPEKNSGGLYILTYFMAHHLLAGQVPLLPINYKLQEYYLYRAKILLVITSSRLAAKVFFLCTTFYIELMLQHEIFWGKGNRSPKSSYL